MGFYEMMIKYLSIIVLSLLWGNNIFAKTITLSKCYVNIVNDFENPSNNEIHTMIILGQKNLIQIL